MPIKFGVKHHSWKALKKMKADERIKLREVPAGVDANIATREKSKAEELEALLEAHRGERHIIVLQSFFEPALDFDEGLTDGLL